jgi:hypothetical protein
MEISKKLEQKSCKYNTKNSEEKSAKQKHCFYGNINKIWKYLYYPRKRKDRFPKQKYR